MLQLRVPALAAAAAVGCAWLGCASPPAAVAGKDDAWFQDLLAREAAPLPEIALEGPGGRFTARVAARGAGPFARSEAGYDHVDFDIGAEGPLRCDFFDDEQDLAGSLAGISDAIFAQVERELGALQARSIYGVDAGAVGASPFLALDWLYRIEDKLGMLKQRMAVVSGRSLYCHHDEIGYGASFARVFEGLVASLRYAEPIDPPAYYAEVLVTSIGEQRVGVQRTEMSRDEDGDTRIMQAAGLLIPRSQEAVFAVDSFDVEWSRPDGTLISRSYNRAEAGELVASLRLDALDDGWHVSGTHKNKPIELEFVSEEPLVSYLGESLLLRRAAAAGGRSPSVEFLRWMPSADPSAPMQTRVELLDPRPGGEIAARAVQGSLEMDVVLGRDGMLRSGRMDLGITTLAVERVHASGSF